MKKILLSLALLSYLVPVKAQATITNEISCTAALSLRDGARITYQISGMVEFNDVGQLINQPNLFITILRRERNGIERLVRNQEQLGYFENDAPDADYSLLPFSGNFRAAPNNGSGIYHLSSANNGLYVRLIPRDSAAQQIQVVHYLSRSRFVRSAAFPCSLRGE